MDDFTWRSWTSQDGLALWARDYAGIAGRARLPVICIHGLTRNARDFETVAPTGRAGATGSGGGRARPRPLRPLA